MPHNMLTDSERADGWRLLFDGHTTGGWRGYRLAGVPGGWQVVEGALTRVAPAGDLITVDRFGDFELWLEWTVAPGGNSGIFYRATEATKRIYENAPELQVLDDAGHRDGLSPLTSAGALYGLYPSPGGVVRPAGEWNDTRIVARGNHVEHWLNGRRVVAYELGSAEWRARVAASKFAACPSYGRAAKGHIGVQDHGDRVAYRSVKILELG